MNFKKWLTPRNGIIALSVVHFFGVIGLLSPLGDLFLAMTPVTLTLSVLALLFTQEAFSTSLKIAICVIGILGYAVEVLGVATGFPFGEYSYGPVLGPHVLAVPPMIGINWILVVLAASAVSGRFCSSRILSVILASAFMVAFDCVLEPVAVALDFWQWHGRQGIPLSNYVAWFVISLVFCSIWQTVAHERRERDHTSFALMWIQVAFFGVLRVLLD